MAKNKRKKYYAVAKGHKTGVYSSWDDCKEQVHGYSRNQFKGFATKSEAEDYVQKHCDSNNTAPSYSKSPQDSSNPVSSHSSSAATQENSRKRIRLEEYGTKTDPKRTSSTPKSTMSSASSPYEYSYDAYCGEDDDDDPVRDYYHSHGFYGYS